MERYWLWMGARLLAALVVILGAVFYVTGMNKGEKEFQKTLDAMKQVKSFRAAYIADPMATEHSEALWEVDCNRGILRHVDHRVESSTNPPTEWNRDELMAAGKKYERKDGGDWSPDGYAPENYSAKYYCVNLAQGTDTRVLPDVATIIHRAILDEGDKKTINGVRCREWKLTMRAPRAELAHATVCIGLEDHLPYEVTTDYNRARYEYSDYNREIQFDLPEAVVQATGAGSSTN